MTLFAAMAPTTARNVLLIVVGCGYLGYHLFHLWRRWRDKTRGEDKVKVEGQGQERKLPTDSEGTVERSVPSALQSGINETCVGESNADRTPVATLPHKARCARVMPEIGPHRPAAIDRLRGSLRSGDISPSAFASLSTSISTSLSGEELYKKARAIPHQPIPDFDFDGAYLELLGKSAAQGYAPAMSKLGEYAMRRAAWVEAYYWMWMARRRGMSNLESAMREIRKNWAMGGFSDEVENITPIFPEETGSIGRALLHIGSGHEAAVAREFLRTHHPEFL